MQDLTLEKKLHYTLRIAVAMCFIGHGAFGIITKPIWCNYFAVFGIGHDTAYRLMPILGAFDILAGIGVLIYPVRAMPAWLVFWGAVTALLRPLSGEPFAEFIERAGNFGAPLALLILTSGMPGGGRGEAETRERASRAGGGATGSGEGRGQRGGLLQWLLTPLRPNGQVTKKTWTTLALCLRIVAFLLLAGHGWLNVIGKKGLLGQYTSIGITDPPRVATLIGWLEVLGGIMALVRPWRPLLLILLVWKMASELLYPHYELFEWVERGGSYGVLLALCFMADQQLQWVSSPPAKQGVPG
jgi:hypothetical protein